MNTIKVDIINPKATQLLKDMEDLNLISIRETSMDGFLHIVKRLRAKAKNNPPSMDEITKEVEKVRLKRHAKKSR